MQEWPATVKFEGLPAEPVRVQLAERPVSWQVRRVQSRDVGEDRLTSGAIRERYRLRVFGPLPYSPDVGESALVVTTYVGKPYWWVRPDDAR